MPLEEPLEIISHLRMMAINVTTTKHTQKIADGIRDGGADHEAAHHH